MLSSWQEANRKGMMQKPKEQAPRWKKPAVGWIKVNIDVALDERRGRRAWVWVARDHQGEFLAGDVKPCKQLGWRQYLK
ncbi:unnamed protein product [Cuscuta epithymum]|uniref:Uncharacterized protein n=1 Tax=Cuscuta epithymum TaxID=186058 RepID=A0AAV0DRH7_9ASTE|nr:unnamed protein product [Cuscuta epithymum]